MFIPYTNTEIKVLRFTQICKYYTTEECHSIETQLSALISPWRGFLDKIKHDNYYLCIIDKSAVNKLDCYKDIVNEINHAITRYTPLVVSFIILEKRLTALSTKTYSQRFRFIKCVSTVIQYNSFGTYIIKRVEKQIRKKLLPHYIIDDSISYWVKYLFREYNIITKTDYNNFICENKLLGLLSWDKLVEILPS